MKKVSIFVSKNNPHSNLCQTHVDFFLSHLRTLGYAERTLRKKRPVAASFARWTVGKQLTVNDLNESHLTDFVDRLHTRQNARIKFEMAALRPFLSYLRQEAVVPNPPMLEASPVDDYKRTYIEYLRKERGLAENSILVYSPFISDFLNDRLAQTGCISFHALDALTIQNFLLDRIQNRSREYSRLLAAALRSFLRFLYLRKETTSDLSLSVPRVRKWHQSEVIGFLNPDQVEQILSSTDLSTPRGRRDYAILLFLARLGLRAGEIITIELGDILWRIGEIVIRGKGRAQDRLPLLSDVGAALAVYLRQDRGNSVSRRVFLRMNAPRVGMAGPGAIGHVVRLAFDRAGICAPSRGAAHLFRHGLATRMIRHGASIAEISEVLRHQSQSSTAIYAKVDFETLREVAPPWPGQGGVR
jgi:site-specific recombinase XerD